MSTHVHMKTTPVLGLIITEDDVVLDISAATATQIAFTSPDSVVTTLTATFTTNGSDGKIQITATGTFLNQPGVWKMQGIVTLPDSLTPWKSDIVTFPVLPNL